MLLVLVFRVVVAITLRESIAAWRRKHSISHQTRQEIENFEKVQLHFHQAKSFDERWQSVCFAADEMGFVMGKRTREYYEQHFGHDRSVSRIIQAVEVTA